MFGPANRFGLPYDVRASPAGSIERGGQARARPGQSDMAVKLGPDQWAETYINSLTGAALAGPPEVGGGDRSECAVPMVVVGRDRRRNK